MNNNEWILTTAGEVVEFINTERFVLINYKKQDGTERFMWCTLDFTNVPGNKRPNGNGLGKTFKDIERGLFRVFDLEIQEWRSIKFQNIVWLEAWIGNPLHKKVRVQDAPLSTHGTGGPGPR